MSDQWGNLVGRNAAEGGSSVGLRVGLDIGIASVGWCVIDPDAEQIVGVGVRIFQRAENPKTGASLALPRRMARSARRRLHRRRIRMQRLRELYVSTGLLSPDAIESTFVLTPNDKTPYELRVEGLDRRLSEREWSRVLSQLCKRRGYKSMRLGEEKDSDDGVVKAAIAANKQRMAEMGYRTAGEMLLLDEAFAEGKRNKGDYKGVISRELLLDEIALLFEAQRTAGNPFASTDFEHQYLEILTWQAPIKEGDELIAMVGKCSIDGKNRRIPLACPTFERFRLFDKLHNIRYTPSPGQPRVGLSAEQRATVVSKAFELVTPRTYADVRSLLGLPLEARFVGVRYDSRTPEDTSAEKKEKLPHPKAWHEMSKAVKALSPELWARLARQPELLDQVATVLTYYKYDESVERELTALGLDADVVGALRSLRFSGNGHLSRETLTTILPHMEQGLSYSDACAACGLHHSKAEETRRHTKLPAIPADELRNPVVLRALSQSRKVLNAIIGEFGPIQGLNIELGRDVARSYDDRRKIERTQKKNRDANESVLEDLRSKYGKANPRPVDLVKHKLWQEQGGKCVYSGTPIDPIRLVSGEPGIAEIDHVLPHSRSFDDGYMNKVLVTTKENRDKREQTPFEYMGGDPDRWHEFEERVLSMHLPRPKQERLLRREFDERAAEEFRDRNLTDMQYIARFFKDFVEQNLEFEGDAKLPVMTVNGRATAYLRTAWQFQKVRADGDLHHALDAAVIAATTRSMVQQVSRFFSVRPLRNPDGVYVDTRTGEVIDAKHVPEPWEGFRVQVEALLESKFSADPFADLQDAELSPKPILVSRMPNRTVRGEAHKETVKRLEGNDEKGRIKTSKKVRLEDLTPRLLQNMVGAGQDRDLYDALDRQLAAHQGDGAKAFKEPFYKPTRLGRTAPRVRSIRVYDDPSSGGTAVRGGLADNGVMVRTDVFEKDGKYYLVPVYLKDVAAGVLPDKAIVQGRAENNWRPIDDTYRFAFSLHINDLVRLVKKSGDGADTWFGYFKGTNRSDGGILVEPHDSSADPKKLGVAQGVISFDKIDVDVLGREVHRVMRGHRHGFSNRGDRERS
jgi:CRISPR-associated endonuclease Csn1